MEGPEADAWLDDEVAVEPIHPPADEDHMLARMVGLGGRENGAGAEGDELLDDGPAGGGLDRTEWDGE